MKRFIVKIFRIVYQITGAKLFSFAFALLYITGLNLVTIYGLALLLAELFPTSFILRFFSFPYLYFTFAVILGLNIVMGPSFNSILAERKKRADNAPVIMYTVISALLFIYSAFYDKI